MAEQGRLDLLVNAVWGGNEVPTLQSDWGHPSWELPAPEYWDRMFESGLRAAMMGGLCLSNLSWRTAAVVWCLFRGWRDQSRAAATPLHMQLAVGQLGVCFWTCCLLFVELSLTPLQCSLPCGPPSAALQHAARIMAAEGSGLIIQVSFKSPGDAYIGNLFYDVAKAGLNRYWGCLC